MPLIDKSYFTGELRHIPNLNDPNRVATLNDFIADLEPEFLKTLFGVPLYTDYAAGILLEPIPEQWTALQAESIKEAFANYVYYWWMRIDRTKSTVQGEMVPSAENGTIVFNNDKPVTAWNRIWPLVQPFALDMDTKRTTYTTWPYGYQLFLYQAFRPINVFGI